MKQELGKETMSLLSDSGTWMNLERPKAPTACLQQSLAHRLQFNMYDTYWGQWMRNSSWLWSNSDIVTKPCYYNFSVIIKSYTMAKKHFYPKTVIRKGVSIKQGMSFPDEITSLPLAKAELTGGYGFVAWGLGMVVLNQVNKWPDSTDKLL